MRFVQKNQLHCIICLLICFTVFGCASSGTKESDYAAIAAGDPPISGKYQCIVFQDFDISPQLVEEYPTAATECQSNAISWLLMKNKYNTVDKFKSGSKYPNGTLIVRAKITDLRIVGAAGRFWAGALAGSSNATVAVQFIDPETNQTIRDKVLSSSTSAMGGAWTMGQTDQNLVSDMGKIIAEYIVATVPIKQG